MADDVAEAEIHPNLVKAFGSKSHPTVDKHGAACCLVFPISPDPDDPIRDATGRAIGYMAGAEVEDKGAFIRLRLVFDLALDPTTKRVDMSKVQPTAVNPPNVEVDLTEELT